VCYCFSKAFWCKIIDMKTKGTHWIGGVHNDRHNRTKLRALYNPYRRFVLLFKRHGVIPR